MEIEIKIQGIVIKANNDDCEETGSDYVALNVPAGCHAIDIYELERAIKAIKVGLGI